MENNGTEPASIDISALLAGAKTEADRDKFKVAFYSLAETHPDSFAAQIAEVLLAFARSSQDAARRNEDAVRIAQDVAARVERAMPPKGIATLDKDVVSLTDQLKGLGSVPAKVEGLLAQIPNGDHVAALLKLVEQLKHDATHAKEANQRIEQHAMRVDRASSAMERRSFFLNLGWPFVAVALAFGLGMLGMGVWDNGKEQARAKTPEARMAKDFATIGARLEYGVSQNGNRIDIRILPGKTWRAFTPSLDQNGNVAVSLYDPTP